MKILSFCCIRNWQIKSRFLCAYLWLSNILGSFLFLSFWLNSYGKHHYFFMWQKSSAFRWRDCKDLVTVDDWIGSRFFIVDDFWSLDLLEAILGIALSSGNSVCGLPKFHWISSYYSLGQVQTCLRVVKMYHSIVFKSFRSILGVFCHLLVWNKFRHVWDM